MGFGPRCDSREVACEAGRVRVVVVGAGVSGLTAARQLQADGHEVTVLDKGRSPGGRLATRRLAGATFDHGAQFFTVRSPEFQTLVEGLLRDGVVGEWCRGFAAPDGHPRYLVRGGMNALAKHLAAGLDVRCDRLVFAVRRGPDAAGWRVIVDDASEVPADAVVVTSPVPQSVALLVTAEVELPDALLALDYDRTLGLLAVLDRAPAVPAPGGVQQPGGLWNFIGDNAAKGISAVPAVTFHAAAGWSLEHWDDPPDAIERALLDAAEPWFGGANLVDHQVKRWRFATPRTPWPDPCWQADAASPLVLAGDAFAGPKVEGAYLSGLAAAAAVSARH